MAHFPIKNHYNVHHFSTTLNNPFFPTVLHSYFSTKIRTKFNFLKTFTNDKPDACATIIQNSTNHVATLPTGNIGYIEVPIRNEKPKFYQVHDINSLVNRVAHTYHSEIPKPIVPTKYYEDTLYYPLFSLNLIYMTDSSITPNIPNSLCNNQPFSDTTKLRIFLFLPYTKENLKFIKKIQLPIF